MWWATQALRGWFSQSHIFKNLQKFTQVICGRGGNKSRVSGDFIVITVRQSWGALFSLCYMKRRLDQGVCLGKSFLFVAMRSDFCSSTFYFLTFSYQCSINILRKLSLCNYWHVTWRNNNIVIQWKQRSFGMHLAFLCSGAWCGVTVDYSVAYAVHLCTLQCTPWGKVCDPR